MAISNQVEKDKVEALKILTKIWSDRLRSEISIRQEYTHRVDTMCNGVNLPSVEQHMEQLAHNTHESGATIKHKDFKGLNKGYQVWDYCTNKYSVSESMLIRSIDRDLIEDRREQETRHELGKVLYLKLKYKSKTTLAEHIRKASELYTGTKLQQRIRDIRSKHGRG